MTSYFEELTEKYLSKLESSEFSEAFLFSFAAIFIASVLQYSRGLILHLDNYYDSREYIELGFGVIDPILLTFFIFSGFVAASAVIYLAQFLSDTLDFKMIFSSLAYASIIGVIASLGFNILFFAFYWLEITLLFGLYFYLAVFILIAYNVFLYTAYKGLVSQNIRKPASIGIISLFSVIWPLTTYCILYLFYILA